MKNQESTVRIAVITIIAVSILAACSQIMVPEEVIVTGNNLDTRTEFVIDSTFLVSENDMEQYVIKQEMADKSKRCIKIEPISYSSLPVGYVVQYESGWEILSADKRGPIWLASAEDGQYDYYGLPEGPRYWIDMLFSQVADRWQRHLETNYDNEDEICSLDYWKYTASNNLIETRDPGIVQELISTEYYQEYYDRIDHLTSTRWYQKPTYNAACPFVQQGSSNRAPAGCVPIAGAQLLYYLHYYWGVPDKAPSLVYCSDYLPSQNVYSSGPVSTTIWSHMNNNTSSLGNKAYFLVQDLAKRMNVIYHENTADSHLDSLVHAFADYGIHSESSVYQKDTVINHLLRGIPVPVRAKKVNSNIGHAFLIDAYKRYRTKVVETYLNYYVDPSGGPVPMPFETQNVYYTSPYVKYIRMNWGYGDITDNYVDYSPQGSWVIDGILLNHDFKMIHDISIL